MVGELNDTRPDSALALSAALADITQLNTLAQRALAHWQRLDVLINNASSFYPTPLGTAAVAQWGDLMGSHVKAPLFLAQALLQPLRRARGTRLMMGEIYPRGPLNDGPIDG